MAWLLAFPFLFAVSNSVPLIQPLEWLGVALAFVSISGESMADEQLQAFKANPANRGRVCNVGLWQFSRHPNYFFEWLNWMAFALFCWPSPMGWTSLFSALILLFLIFRVTGIPATEAQAIKTRGDLYRKYQEETSRFFPWFPKRSNEKGAS